MKKICIITATRAEYGLLHPLMKKVEASPVLTLQLLVTGAHLSPEFGNTWQDIEKDGFRIDERVDMLLSADTGNAIVKSMGVGMIGYADAFSRLQPDMVVILGDRYEMVAVAMAAATMKIPVAHIHGGEITEGAYDDAFRHAITKLSHLHFTSTEAYRKRVIQMGEQPGRVFNVGAIGLDNIINKQLLSRVTLEEQLGITLKPYNYQVTFHPETLSHQSAAEQFQVLLQVIKAQEDSFFVFTKSNADTDGRIINQMIDVFTNEYPEKAKGFTSLGSLRFLSLVHICDAIVGNSSSGIIEAPSLKTATINIGNRQLGRIQATSVINCSCIPEELFNAFEKVRNSTFREQLADVENPYGDGNTAGRICAILEKTDFATLLLKKFNDLIFSYE